MSTVNSQAFFVYPRDSHVVRALKLEALTHVVTPHNADRVLQELQVCLRDTSKPFVVLAVRAVGWVAARLPNVAGACMRSLMELSNHPCEEVAAEAVVVIRALIQQRPQEHCGVIIRLVRATLPSQHANVHVPPVFTLAAVSTAAKLLFSG